MLLLISGHWFACLWVMVAELEPPDQTTWIDELHGSLRPRDDDGGGGYAVAYGSEEDAAAAREAHLAAAACEDDELACQRQMHHSLKVKKIRLRTNHKNDETARRGVRDGEAVACGARDGWRGRAWRRR